MRNNISLIALVPIIATVANCTTGMPTKYYLRSKRVKEVGVSMPVYQGADSVGSVTSVGVVNGDAIVEISLKANLKVGRNAHFQMRKVNPLEEVIEITGNDRRNPYEKGDTIPADLGNTELF